MRRAVAFLLLLTAVFAAGSLCGREVPVAPLLPSYTAMAVKLDVAALLKNPQLRQFLLSETGAVNRIEPENIDLAVIGCDNKAKKPFLVLRFKDDAGWQKLWQALEGRIEPLAAERRIMLFRLNAPELPPEAGRVHFAVLAPKVAAFYFRCEENFRCDYRGCPEKLQRIFSSTIPAVAAGMPKIKEKAFRGIQFFTVSLVGKYFYGVVTCRDQLTASLTMVAMQGSAAIWMQQYCGMTPEETAQMLQKIEFRQKKGTLYINVSMDTVWEVLKKAAVIH